MKKSRLLLMLFLFCMTISYGQIDSCQVNPFIQANYEVDAWMFVIDEVEGNTLHPYHDSIDIPYFLLERPLKAMSIIYDMTGPERDTVFNLMPIHVFGSSMEIYSWIMMKGDGSYPWVQQLLTDSTWSGNPTYDSLMASRGFKMESWWNFTQLWIMLKSPHPYNRTPLIDQLIQIPGVVSAYPDAMGGDGPDIYYYRGQEADSFVFDYGWGDCMAGCIYNRYFCFQASPDCSGTHLYTYGDPFPQPVSVENPVQDISVYPNPFTDFLYFRLPEPEKYRVEMYTLSGQLITVKPADEGFADLTGLAEGTYYLRIVDDNMKGLSSMTVTKIRR